MGQPLLGEQGGHAWKNEEREQKHIGTSEPGNI